MELKSIGLSQQVKDQLHSIGRQKEASPLETLEMTLRQHFEMPIPQMKMRESKCKFRGMLNNIN